MSKVESQFVLFPTAEECARIAASVFVEHKWRWTGHGIPDETEILVSLRSLKAMADERRRDYAESGRLVYYQGRFGYQRPLGVLANSVFRRRDTL